MACPTCQRRSALVAAIAPAISRLPLTHHGLLGLLALGNERLLAAARIDDPGRFLRSLQIAPATDAVPTALCRHDPDYPAALRQLPSAPAVLYASCPAERLRELLAAPTVAIVGSRTHTDYAHEISSALARDLATAAITIVSGMNTGLEGNLHKVAAEASGHTIAVMPGGADIAFPRLRQYEDLHTDLHAHGAAVSEFPPGFIASSSSPFIASQRIIAALAGVIVLIEAGGRSCALFTTQIAANLGADVAVVPGRLTDPGGKWLFELLRDGAHPISCGDDVLELLAT
jgi:DNA processing protein